VLFFEKFVKMPKWIPKTPVASGSLGFSTVAFGNLYKTNQGKQRFVCTPYYDPPDFLNGSRQFTKRPFVQQKTCKICQKVEDLHH